MCKKLALQNIVYKIMCKNVALQNIVYKIMCKNLALQNIVYKTMCKNLALQNIVYKIMSKKLALQNKKWYEYCQLIPATEFDIFRLRKHLFLTPRASQGCPGHRISRSLAVPCHVKRRLLQ